MPIHPKTTGIKSFKGLNNVLRPERTPQEYLKCADNVDIDKSGGIQKRKGYSLVSSGSWHSVWSDGPYCFGVKGGDLVSISTDYSTQVIKAGMGESPVSYFRLDDLVYFSSESFNGVIENGTVRPWGIKRPNPRPSLASGDGQLEVGVYQVSVTFVSQDGRESGASVSSQILVPDHSSIVISNIPTSSDSTVSEVFIYMSYPNGQEIYYKDSITNGTTSHTIYNTNGLVVPIDTFNKVPAPLGHIVAEAHARSWIAEDNYLWFSDPYAYEYFSLAESYIRFPERIRALMPTDSGMWVASDKLYYIAGKEPDKAKMMMREPIKVVEGSAVRIPGAYIFIDNTPIGYKWIVHSDKGIYVCFDDGITLNMTSQNYEFPSADEGAAAFIQEDGINRYISLLKQPRDDSENATVGDLVTATVIRNGVVVDDENTGEC